MANLWHWTIWRRALIIACIGGILSGAIIAAIRFVLAWVLPSMHPYSSPDLLLHALVVLHVAFWLRPLAGEIWWAAGLMLGFVAHLSAWLFPYDAHSLLPYHWSGLTCVPAAFAGMALAEAFREER